LTVFAGLQLEIRIFRAIGSIRDAHRERPTLRRALETRPGSSDVKVFIAP
jgi:hypothetical protein